jgi:hypothetical protein
MMWNKKLLFLLLAVLIAQPAIAKDKAVLDKRPKTYKIDLDGDSKIEIIRIEDASAADKETKVIVTRKDSADIGSFMVPGIFNKLELIDLSEDGCKQIAVYCAGKDNYTNLAIYSFKNNKFSRVFSAGSNCGMDTDFRSVLARVKIGRQRRIEKGNSYTDIPEWDVWVWSGERFIRE